MEIFEKLNEVDEQMKESLNELEEKRIREELEEEERKKQMEKEKKLKKEEDRRQEYKSILESDLTKLDEPQLYTITYTYTENDVSFRYGGPVNRKKGSLEIVMTEREKRLAEMTGELKEITDSHIGPLNVCLEILDIKIANREMSEKEKITAEATKRKVEAIKNSPEGENRCIINLVYNKNSKSYEERNKNIEVETKLKYALLSTLNVENGKIIYEEKQEVAADNEVEDVKEVSTNQEPKNKITLGSIGKALLKVLNRGER